MNIFKKLKFRIRLSSLFRKSWNWKKQQTKYVHMTDEKDRDILVSLEPIAYELEQIGGTNTTSLFADDALYSLFYSEEYIVHAVFKVANFPKSFFGHDTRSITINPEELDKETKWIFKYL